MMDRGDAKAEMDLLRVRGWIAQLGSDADEPWKSWARMVNDGPWSSDAARTEAMLPVTLMAGPPSDGWEQRLAEATIRRVLPVALRAVGLHWAAVSRSARTWAADKPIQFVEIEELVESVRATYREETVVPADFVVRTGRLASPAAQSRRPYRRRRR